MVYNYQISLYYSGEPLLLYLLIGLLYFFRGAGNFIGQYLTGALYDATHSYEYGCYMSAACLWISSVLTEVAHFLHSRSKTETTRQELN